MNGMRLNLMDNGQQATSLMAGLLFVLVAGLALAGCDLFGEAIDERAPRVEILRPGTSAQVAGANVLVSVSAESIGDDNFISFINVTLNGQRLGEAVPVGEEYILRWNSFDFPDGEHRLEAVAFDRMQARGISTPVNIVITNQSAGQGPESLIVSPKQDEEVSGVVSVIVRPEVGQPPIKRVDFLVDGIAVASANQPTSGDSYIFEWNTLTEYAGLHVLEVKAFSDDGVFQLSQPVSVQVRAGVPEGQDPGVGKLRFRAVGFSGDVKGSVGVGFNNDLYIGTTEDTLYAYSRTGRPRWAFATNGAIRSSPLIGNNEDVFVTSEDGRLYGVNSEGQPLWTPYNTGAILRTTPAMGIEGALYFGDSEGRLHAVNSFNGLKLPGWPVSVSPSPIVVPPVLGEDRTIIVAATDGHVYAVSHEGNQLWRSEQNLGSISVGLALASRSFTIPLPDGSVRTTKALVVYAVSNDGFIYAVSGQDGSVMWSYPLNGPLRSGPVVGTDGAIYIGTSTGLIALNEEANAFTPRLRFIFPAEDVGTPVIDTNEIVYFVSGAVVHAINPNNTPIWTFNLNAEADGPLTINREGLLLVAGNNGLLYALDTGSVGLAPGKWPMFQRNARHTGRLGLDADDG